MYEKPPGIRMSCVVTAAEKTVLIEFSLLVVVVGLVGKSVAGNVMEGGV